MSNNLLEPNYWSIKQVFDFQYNIPVYQRPYSWQTDQVDSLYDDIKEAYDEYQAMPTDTQYLAGLYVGNVILHSRSIGVFDIIDGQQRITTFALLIMALYAKSIELNAELTERIVQRLQEALWKLDGASVPQKERRAITLGSIDKDMMMKLFDNAYHAPQSLNRFVMQYDTKSEAEANIKTNFLRLYDNLTDDFQAANELLLLANFILSKVYLIAINTNGSEIKAFSIFESINSKGRKLEDIDLIKTYIFSKLKASDYEHCLSQWGDLIVKTNDELYDFLKTYIKAYVKFYSQNISFNNFKKLSDILCKHFKQTELSLTYKMLLNDMLEKVDYYNALSNINSAYSLIHDSRFRFYYSLFVKLGYEHPKPLFFRLFAEYSNGNISKDDLIEIFIETIKSVVSFLTICQKDSKDEINVFSSIFEGLSNNKTIDKNLILYLLKTKMQTSGLRAEDVSSALLQLDLFDKNKKLGAAIISFYESRNNTGNLKVSWDEAYSKFSTYGEAYSLDHIMVQAPDRNDRNLKYYKLGDTLKLKEGHDFPENIVHDGMEYEAFKSLVLHRAGNLRLKGKDGNLARSNDSEESFCTYAALNNRTATIVKFVVENLLSLEPIQETPAIASALKSLSKKRVGNFDFSLDDLDLTGIKAKTLTVFDKSYELSHNKDILTYLIMYLYSEHENEIVSMAESNWSPRRRIILSNSKTYLASPYELIKDKVYIETNLSSRDIIMYAKDILNALKFPADLVTIYIPE